MDAPLLVQDGQRCPDLGEGWSRRGPGGRVAAASDGGQTFGQVVVDVAVQDCWHDELGVVHPELGFQNVSHDVEVVLAGDDQVDRVLAWPVQLLDLGDRFPAPVFDLASGVLDHEFQVLPGGHDARGQVENSAL